MPDGVCAVTPRGFGPGLSIGALFLPVAGPLHVPLEAAANELQVEIGEEEIAGIFAGSRPSIAVDAQGQPHIVIDAGWGDTLYVFHKLSGDWQEELLAQGAFGSDRNYLPHLEIDAQDRAWISSWVATPNVDEECGQGLWVIEDVATQPAVALETKVYITWSNGNLSLDPSRPGEAVMMGRDGAWQRLDTAGQVLDSGQMYIGQSGEKLRFLISPREGQQGVWHGVTSGWTEYSSAYRSSLMDDPVIWADYAAYPEQGDDLRHMSLGVDGVDPRVAYMAVAHDPGVVLNVWDGQAMIFDPSELPVVEFDPAQHGNGTDRFGPQWAPAADGGAYLCYSVALGWVKLRHVSASGEISSPVTVTKGASCALATDTDGHIHIAYVHEGMRYRKLLVTSQEDPGDDDSAGDDDDSAGDDDEPPGSSANGGCECSSSDGGRGLTALAWITLAGYVRRTGRGRGGRRRRPGRRAGSRRGSRSHTPPPAAAPTRSR